MKISVTFGRKVKISVRFGTRVKIGGRYGTRVKIGVRFGRKVKITLFKKIAPQRIERSEVRGTASDKLNDLDSS